MLNIAAVKGVTVTYKYTQHIDLPESIAKGNCISLHFRCSCRLRLFLRRIQVVRFRRSCNALFYFLCLLRNLQSRSTMITKTTSLDIPSKNAFEDQTGLTLGYIIDHYVIVARFFLHCTTCTTDVSHISTRARTRSLLNTASARCRTFAPYWPICKGYAVLEWKSKNFYNFT